MMQLAAPGIKKVILELGGKGANLVFADADQDLAVRGARAGELAGKGLERAHHGERFCNARGIDRGDDRAAVGQKLDQAFGREYLKGLAQGGTRNAELRGEQALVQPAPGCKGSLDDKVP